MNATTIRCEEVIDIPGEYHAPCIGEAITECDDCGRLLCIVCQLPDQRCAACTLGEGWGGEPVEEATRA